MKNKLLASLVVAASMLLGVTSVNAAGCGEGAIGRLYHVDTAPSAAASQYAFNVSCPASYTGERKYYLSANLGDSGYATLLTSISLNKGIAFISPSLLPGSVITELWMLTTDAP